MLSIQLPNGEFLETGSATIQVELISPLFNEPDKLLGSYSYPFSFPWTEGNKRNLQQAHSMTAANKLRKITVMMWMNGNAWKSAELAFDTTAEEADGNLLIDAGVVNEALKLRKLTEIFWPDNNLHVYSSLSEFLTHMLQTVWDEPGVHPYVFFPIKNENFLGKKTFPDTDPIYANDTLTAPAYINKWAIDINGRGGFRSDYGVTSFAETPFFYLTWVIEQACKLIGYTLNGSYAEDEHLQRLVIYSNRQRGIGFTLGVPGQYLPDLTLSDFFKALRDDYSLQVGFDPLTQTCRIESFASIMDHPKPLDLRKAQLRGYKISGKTNTGFTLIRKADETDTLWVKDDNATTEEMPVLVLGDGSEKREVKVGTTRMITENAPHYSSEEVKWRIPHVSQIGQSAFPGYESFDFTRPKPKVLRMLYWHGMQPDQNGNLYPYGSADNLDFQDLPISSFSLSPNQYNITQVSMARWYKFLSASKQMEVNMLLHPQEFMDMEIHRRVILECDRGSVVNCLIDKISAQLGSRSKMVEAVATLYISLPDNEPESFLGLPSGEVPPPPFDNGTVYLRMSVLNSRPKSETYPDLYITGYIVDVYAEFFEDAAATIPKSVTNLQVKYNINTAADPAENNNDTVAQQACNGTSFMLVQDIYNDYSQQEPIGAGGSYVITYSFNRIFTAIDTADYILL